MASDLVAALGEFWESPVPHLSPALPASNLGGLDDALVVGGVRLDGEGVPELSLHDAVLGHPVLGFIGVLNEQRAQGAAHADVFRHRKDVAG